MSKKIEDYGKMPVQERLDDLMRWMWSELHDFKKEMCKFVGFDYDGDEITGDEDDPLPDSIVVYGELEQLPPLLGSYKNDCPARRLLQYRLEHPDVDPTRYVRSPEFGEIVQTFRSEIALNIEDNTLEQNMVFAIWQLHDVAYRLGLKEFCEHVEAWTSPQ
jgi:hypothetical protein